jgi:hypothetical protein
MVCFPALQFNTAKKQFMATRKVPIPDGHDFEDRSLVVVVRNARAVTQITASFSLA